MKTMKGNFYGLMKKDRGFTLIELLVVIAIIGILSSVVLVSLSAARAKARDAKRVAEIRQFQNVIETYYIQNGSYPIGGDGTPLSCNATNGCLHYSPRASCPPYPGSVDDRWTPLMITLRNAGLIGANTTFTDPLDTNNTGQSCYAYTKLTPAGVSSVQCGGVTVDQYMYTIYFPLETASMAANYKVSSQDSGLPSPFNKKYCITGPLK